MKSNAKPSMIRISAAYAVCSIIQRGISFLTIPIFTRILTTEQYGQTIVYQSWEELLTVFLTLQLPYGSFSKAMVQFEDQRDAYTASVEGICLLLSCVFLLLYLPFTWIWTPLFRLPPPLMVMMVLEILANAGIAFWSGKKRFEYRYIGVISVTLLLSVLTPALQFLFVFRADEKGYAKIAGGAVAMILTGGVIFILGIIKGKKIYRKEFWQYAFRFNIPLIVYYLSQILFNTSDRIMIDRMCGTDNAGIYGTAYNLAMALTFVLNAVNNSYTPWIYQKIKEKKQAENKNVSNAVSVLLAFLLMGVIWFAPEIIYLLGGQAYTEAKWVVFPVALSILLLFYTQISANYEFYFEDKKTLILAAVSSALINIFLNAVLIPVFGYCAAGYTTLCSYLFLAYCNYLGAKRIAREQKIEDMGIDVKMLCLLFLAAALTGSIGMVLYDFLILRIIITIIVLFVLFLFRKKVADSYHKIKNALSK